MVFGMMARILTDIALFTCFLYVTDFTTKNHTVFLLHYATTAPLKPSKYLATTSLREAAPLVRR